MEKIRCSHCQLINWPSAVTCKRCGFGLGAPSLKSTDSTVDPENLVPKHAASSNRVRKAGRKKMVWGAAVLIVGLGITFAFYIGGYDFRRVGFFSIVTIGPIVVLLVGVFEAITGISIFAVIEKWDKLPEWQRWVLGVLSFFAFTIGLLFIVAVIIFNFF